MTVVFSNVEGLLSDRRICRRDDGSFVEDGYDFGVWWRDRQRGAFRLTWVGPAGRDDESAEPGELYLVRLGFGAREEAELLCVIPPAASVPDADVEEILDGWADVCGAEGSVDWVRARVAAALCSGRARPPQALGEVRR